ncbi:hypothetical protein HanXRQr2_Chr09g0371651 [Helianthus annuus]|uniref:Uncharacterized protein n=1 Tax=Helianthus annuus TaxID=4232 RepID=A0A9K3I3D6_HELAN|nr:hypothetical protein HanXRQr2_Chr09g0371651 [Helianthus annuus]KAJ0891780.1 hypothetical protein HanPSC8_Chr09g0358071 [Helianthus annuus]
MDKNLILPGVARPCDPQHYHVSRPISEALLVRLMVAMFSQTALPCDPLHNRAPAGP